METFENASFSMETPKTESFENATTATTTDLVPNKARKCLNRGNENEQKRNNGNTSVFSPGSLGENEVMEMVKDHPKTE